MEKIVYLDATGKTFNYTAGNRLMAVNDEQQSEIEALKNDSKVIELKNSKVETPVQPVVPEFADLKTENDDPINLIDSSVLENKEIITPEIKESESSEKSDNVLINNNEEQEPVKVEVSAEPSLPEPEVSAVSTNPVLDVSKPVDDTPAISETVNNEPIVNETINEPVENEFSQNNELMRGIMEINAERNKEIARLSKEIANVNALYDGKIISLVNSKKKIINKEQNPDINLVNPVSDNKEQSSDIDLVNPVSDSNVIQFPTNVNNENQSVIMANSNGSVVPGNQNEVISMPMNQQVINNDDFARTLKVS